jgi:hypothetical protein
MEIHNMLTSNALVLDARFTVKRNSTMLHEVLLLFFDFNAVLQASPVTS